MHKMEGRGSPMYDYFFTFHSLTRAQQAVFVLRRYGILANLDRVPKRLGRRDCGYGILIQGTDGYSAAAKLRMEGVAPEVVFRIGYQGEAEETFL